MSNNDAVSAQNAERFILTANFDRMIRIKDLLAAEVVGRNRDGLLLRLEQGVPAIAPLPVWCDLTVESGTQVFVQVHAMTDQWQVHCRLLRVME